jgi:hypothetical protein
VANLQLSAWQSVQADRQHQSRSLGVVVGHPVNWWSCYVLYKLSLRISQPSASCEYRDRESRSGPCHRPPRERWQHCQSIRSKYCKVSIRTLSSEHDKQRDLRAYQFVRLIFRIDMRKHNLRVIPLSSLHMLTRNADICKRQMPRIRKAPGEINVGLRSTSLGLVSPQHYERGRQKTKGV